MALSYNNAFELEFRSLVEGEIARLVENLSQGTSVDDWGGYQHEVGKIAGLRLALERCDDTHGELEKR